MASAETKFKPVEYDPPRRVYSADKYIHKREFWLTRETAQHYVLRETWTKPDGTVVNCGSRLTRKAVWGPLYFSEDEAVTEMICKHESSIRVLQESIDDHNEAIRQLRRRLVLLGLQQPPKGEAAATAAGAAS